MILRFIELFSHYFTKVIKSTFDKSSPTCLSVCSFRCWQAICSFNENYDICDNLCLLCIYLGIRNQYGSITNWIQSRGKLFYGGRGTGRKDGEGSWGKMWATTKNNKPIWLKRPKTVPQKIKLGPKFYILNFFFENIISGIQLFHIRPVDIIRDLFFNFTTSSRNSQNQQKLTKKITHFIIQFCSKNLTHFTNLNSLDTESNIISQHSQ